MSYGYGAQADDGAHFHPKYLKVAIVFTRVSLQYKEEIEMVIKEMAADVSLDSRL